MLEIIIIFRALVVLKIDRLLTSIILNKNLQHSYLSCKNIGTAKSCELSAKTTYQCLSLHFCLKLYIDYDESICVTLKPRTRCLQQYSKLYQ